MIKIGFQVICNRCEIKKFVESDEVNSSSDVRQADMPEGWVHYGYPIGDLCPSCAKKLDDMMGKFFAEK